MPDEQVKQLACLEGIGYQPYVRKVITQHVRESDYKLERFLTPDEATEKEVAHDPARSMS